MNNRIEELADRCWQQTGKGFLPLQESSGLGYAASYEFDYEKFAQLLVQDCLDICQQQYKSSWNDDRKMQAKLDRDLIKEHFGVGE